VSKSSRSPLPIAELEDILEKTRNTLPLPNGQLSANPIRDTSVGRVQIMISVPPSVALAMDRLVVVRGLRRRSELITVLVDEETKRQHRNSLATSGR
jgi:hypothetical protein